MVVLGEGFAFQRDFATISHHLPHQLFPDLNQLLNLTLDLIWSQ
jgi:hypothetical protein